MILPFVSPILQIDSVLEDSLGISTVILKLFELTPGTRLAWEGSKLERLHPPGLKPYSTGPN